MFLYTFDYFRYPEPLPWVALNCPAQIYKFPIDQTEKNKMSKKSPKKWRSCRLLMETIPTSYMVNIFFWEQVNDDHQSSPGGPHDFLFFCVCSGAAKPPRTFALFICRIGPRTIGVVSDKLTQPMDGRIQTLKKKALHSLLVRISQPF